MQAHRVLDQLHGYKTRRLKAWEWNSSLHSIWEPPSQQWRWSPSSSSEWCIMSWSSFVRIWNLHLQVLNLSHTKSFGLSSSLVHACFLQQQNYWGRQCNQGPIVTLNLKRADGSWVGYREVEKLAALSNIQLRVSCFQDATSSSKQAICKRK